MPVEIFTHLVRSLRQLRVLSSCRPIPARGKFELRITSCRPSASTVTVRMRRSAVAGVRAVWGAPVMGSPGPHNARDMGTGPPQISSVIGTGGARISGDMGIL